MTGESSTHGRAPAEDESVLREALSGTQPRRRNATLGLVNCAEDGGLAPDTVASLITRARSDESADVRQFAVEALGIAKDGIEAIEEGLSDDNEWVRSEAVVAFSRADPERIKRLKPLVKTDESGWVRRNALIALCKQQEASRNLLVDRLQNDPHPSVREYATQYLPEADGNRKETIRLLSAVLAREPNAFVRVRAAEGLGELGTDRAISVLETHGLTDGSDDVERAARHALVDARGGDFDESAVDGPSVAKGGPNSRIGSEIDGERRHEPHSGNRSADVRPSNRKLHSDRSSDDTHD